MQRSYNPDVLSCLANLSNDEVFTPPQVVNRMLDMLPPELWSNPQATFLDPVGTTGVFLCEVAKRLLVGLAARIPDVQDRDGTHLTSLSPQRLLQQVGKRQILRLHCFCRQAGKHSIYAHAAHVGTGSLPLLRCQPKRV